MISEESWNTEDWSNACWKFSFAITGINYIFKTDNILNYYKSLVASVNIQFS